MPEHPLQLRLDPISGRPGAYKLTCDPTHYSVTLDPERNIAFSNLLRRLPAALVGERDPAGELAPQELLRAIGTYLWRALFPDEIPAEQRGTLVRALRSGTLPLLLTLPDALAELPWELLCDPERGDKRGFLARRRPLLRFVPAEVSLPATVPPLRVLVLISSPLGLGEDSRVDVESERAAIEQATREAREAGLLHVWIEDFVTPKRVQQALMRFRPHIVHYIGHGGYDAQAGGILLWEDEQGNELPFTDRRLADLLRPRGLHAVVLHACQTGRRDARSDVLGVAGTLVSEGIPAVLAQQGRFTYASSQRASEAWYTALTSGLGFADALFEVRQALVQADRPDWAVPILSGSTACLEPLLDSGAAPGPPDPALASSRSADLPTPTGVFVGRHRELRALRLMLESPPGSGPVLALITGPGGVGKSTLAAQAVTRYGGKYKAALTLSCQGYQSVELFLQRIGELLKRQGIRGFLEQTLPDSKLSTEAKIEEAIVVLNQAGPFLLVVDNLENVQNGDQTLRDASLLHLLQKLLTNLLGGRVLITGRYEVKGLLPGGKFAAHLLRLNLNDLSPYETNQLLQRHPTLAALGEVVRQMLVREFGGLPYVYDLLSSKAANENLNLLIHDVQGRITQERQRRTAEEWREVRRQIVEFAALEETVSRLAEPSRMLLAQLGVLHQSFPFAAIEQGLGAGRTVWQPLLDRSLLHYDPLEQTYRLHSLTRRYAEDLLDAQDRAQTQVQLAAWYEHYARQESHDLTDMLEAHRLLREAGRVQQAGQLAMQLAETLREVGLYPLLRELCMITLNDIRESEEQLVANALYELGNIALFQGNYEQAQRLSQQSLEIHERLGDESRRAANLHQLGVIAHDQGDDAKAHQLLQQSLEIEKRLGDQSGYAASLHHLGMIAQDQGDYAEAQRFLQQSLEIDKRLGNQSGCAASLHHLGMIAHRQGDYAEAQRLYRQSLEIKERLGDQSGQAGSLLNLGAIAQEQGDYAEAQRLFRQSLEIDKRLGNQSGYAASLHRLGMIAQEQGDYAEAQRLFRQSLEIDKRLGNQLGCATTLGQLGLLAYEQKDFENALIYTAQAFIVFDFLQAPSRETAQRTLARICNHMEEAQFTKIWQNIAGDRPLPELPEVDVRPTVEELLHAYVELIQAPTREAKQRFLETHPALLQPELDELWQDLAAQIKDDHVREVIQDYRRLLARCREVGVDAAFADDL